MKRTNRSPLFVVLATAVCCAIARQGHAAPRTWTVADWNCESVYQKRATWAETMAASRAAHPSEKPGFQAFYDGSLRGNTAARQISVSVAGLDSVWLCTEDKGERFAGHAAVWGDARLIAADGTETRLCDVAPMAVRIDRGEFRRNSAPGNRPLAIGDRRFAHGLWMHVCRVQYKLDKKYVRLESWIGLEPAADKRDALAFRVLDRLEPRVWPLITADYPMECDWMIQDLEAAGFPCGMEGPPMEKYPGKWFSGEAAPDVEKRIIEHVLSELGDCGRPMAEELQSLVQSTAPPHGRPWLELYWKACRLRRERRLRAMANACRSFVFTKHYNMGGSHYAYTEGQSDAQAERHFVPGAALCLAEVHDTDVRVRTLLEDPSGVIRDPDVSYDGRRVLFSWKKSELQDDYHLYEMDLASGAVRQLTFGLGFADYEGTYQGDGDIIFNSTRCVQTVDCFTTEVSNLYTCDKDGRYLRRLSFDQVHTNFPTPTHDGRVLYTRWEYNDRGQIYPQALFQMNADGTNQTEFYGNNSWFPTTILHARNIPGTQKVLALATGHHSRQTGKLIVIDPSRGRQENSGAQLVAPVRETPAERIDAYGQHGDLFQYPYPLSETEYLVTYAPFGWWPQKGAPTDTGAAGRPPYFSVYYMNSDGRRELLASDPKISCNQPIPAVRQLPLGRPNQVDYSKTTGTFYVQDVYAGPGLQGVPRGTVRKLRVVALDFRAAILGGNGNGGPAGGAFVATPVAIGNGCWDPKLVLGEAEVLEDGSVFFSAPAKTPVYFQAVDERGYVVQTMRSWATLQPGENASCVGCHESKNSSPLQAKPITQALRRPPQTLSPFYGPARGFSFAKEIQPILDRHCIRCHNDRSKLAFDSPEPLFKLRPTLRDDPNKDGSRIEPAFSLLSAEVIDPAAKRRWSDAYLALTSSKCEPKQCRMRGTSTPMVNWISPQSAPPMLAPYSAGAATSDLMRLLNDGHKGAHLCREERDKVACWIDLLVPFCADYIEANAWEPQERARYEHFLAKRNSMAQIEEKNIEEYLFDRQRR